MNNTAKMLFVKENNSNASKYKKTKTKENMSSKYES